MNNYTSIYWLTRLDTIYGVSIGLLVLAVIIGIIYTIGYSEQWNGEDKKKFIESYGRWKKKAFLIGLIGLLFMIFLPTEKQAIMIIAGGKTLNFIQSDSSINKIPGQTTAIISQFLDGQLNKIDSAKSK